MRKIGSSLVALLMIGGLTQASAAESYDVVIKGGTVIDGTGKAGFAADVGVKDGKIVKIGTIAAGDAKAVIDAKGLTVSPGFIDPHNHSGNSIIAPVDKTNAAYLTQGVTTIVEGPDGGMSPADMRKLTAKFEERGIGTNYAFYVGHNGIRREVMGRVHRAPTAAELDSMKALVREGMEFGAVGLSTGLMYEPGMFSKTDEVIALAKEVKPYNGTYDSHTRNPVTDIMGSYLEAIKIGEAAGISPKIGHMKAVGLTNKGKIGDVIDLVTEYRAKGVDVVSDQYPYDGAATANLSDIIILPGDAAREEPWPREEVIAALKDPAKRAAIKDLTEKGIKGGFSWVKAVGYGSMRIVDAPGNPALIDKNLELFAREKGQAPFDLVADLILNAKKPILLTLGSIDEADVQKLLIQPWNMISSDGAYVGLEGQAWFHHPRSTGSFTRILGHYSRDLGLLSLPEAVRKMTSLPADHLHLSDRGRIAVGKAADIVVFDAKTVRDRSTYVNPDVFSEGILFVLVNGTEVIKDGKITGATPGEFVKRQS